ncbi:MAG: FHIPEP family type III secretion protein, partial [Planctomycetes bacterium]|nr:FHIPEP family type III secretion protein [Planctomycetota bacterium]
MADLTVRFGALWRFIGRYRAIILPTAVAGMIFVILVPLPPVVIDLLLAANITLAALILLTTLYISSPLEFAVFPSVLLVTTLFRLVLNIATTRLILGAGADDAGAAEAQFAAGRVIWSFSRFVTSGSLAIGVILFVMLIVIQFVVLTKGAARVSEVAARFVLDAMPGKQTAIDADLSSGMIDQATALRRRDRIAREADFYGSMDGASKFLRGDAIAAAVISLVNILRGLYIGVVQYGWSWSQTAWLFTQLTIGDGLVTQIPALLICVSAGLIVTRSTARSNLGEEMIGQLTARPVVLVITGVFLVLLTLTSLPTLPLLTLGVGCTALAAVLLRRREASKLSSLEDRPGGPPAQRIEDLLKVEAMKIELGYALVGLVDPDKGGVLLERIASVRRQV